MTQNWIRILVREVLCSYPRALLVVPLMLRHWPILARALAKVREYLLI
jgi:hypothetical protein